MNRRAVLAAVVWAWGTIAAPAAGGPADQVRVAVLFGAQRSYRQAASAVEQTLRAHGVECVLFELPKAGDESSRDRTLQQLVAAKPTVIAAGGTAATSLALSAVADVPVVFFMVPNALDAPFMGDEHANPARLLGVCADVSPDDQIDWIARLAPACRHIGVLHSRRTRRTVEAIRSAARKRGIAVSAIGADRNHFPKAIDALNRSGCDGVLMIPDAKVYNAPNVQRLLLWGIRRKKPVWAFSAGVVKAGALAGQYIDSDLVGRQAAELIQQLIGGADISSIGLRYPRQVGRAVNKRTAEMIGLPLSESAIAAATVRYGEE